MAPRSVVITGGTAGVGRAAALRFARAGDRVWVVGRAQSGVDATVREIEAAGGEALGIAADVSERQWRPCSRRSRK
jgi:NAD(P)-dependent dehydrogenase (short-subunit alcohol dehydrogenase family)